MIFNGEMSGKKNFSSQYTALAFWKDHGITILKWNDVAKNIVVLQSSSEAAESLLTFKQYIWRPVTCIVGGLVRGIYYDTVQRELTI